VLNPGDRHRHVRRLKVLRVTMEEERRWKGLQRQDEEAGKDEHQDADTDDWKIHHYFDMHDFCCPSNVSMECSWGASMTDHPKAWLPLANL
jgi:uncharacterized Zn-finger protein